MLKLCAYGLFSFANPHFRVIRLNVTPLAQAQRRLSLMLLYYDYHTQCRVPTVIVFGESSILSFSIHIQILRTSCSEQVSNEICTIVLWLSSVFIYIAEHCVDSTPHTLTSYPIHPPHFFIQSHAAFVGIPTAIAIHKIYITTPVACAS